MQKIKSKLNKNRFQPTGFDLIRLFYIKNQNPINRFQFGLVSVRFDYFILKTETQSTDFSLVWFQLGSIILYLKLKTILFLGFFLDFLIWD